MLGRSFESVCCSSPPKLSDQVEQHTREQEETREKSKNDLSNAEARRLQSRARAKTKSRSALCSSLLFLRAVVADACSSVVCAYRELMEDWRSAKLMLGEDSREAEAEQRQRGRERAMVSDRERWSAWRVCCGVSVFSLLSAVL